MALFKGETHQAIWIDHHCHRCFHHNGSGCPILQRALKSGRKPVEWERNNKAGALMAETMKCNNETRQPPRDGKRDVPDETLAMFDVELPTKAMDSEHQ